jgi:heterodisulfide reductase subunit C2
MAIATTQARAPTFFERVVAATPGETHLEMCIQCGTCGGSCPSGPDMDHTPRALFAMIKEGMENQTLKSNTPWFCVSCYYCTVRCPQDIHITDIMYTLKRLSINKGMYKASSAEHAPGFSKDFIYFVENFGRSFELGLATVYHLTHHPLDVYKLAPFGIGMMRKGRIDILPKRPIKGIDNLKAMLNKAKELEEEELAAQMGGVG